MSVSAKIIEQTGYVEIIFETRISTAVQMLHYTEKLHSDREGYGAWDDFTVNMHDALSLFDVRTDFRPQYFKGHNDVIFEISVIIQPGKDCPHEIHDEKIAGTVLTALCNHLGWTDWNKPTLKQSWQSFVFKHLAVFKER